MADVVIGGEEFPAVLGVAIHMNFGEQHNQSRVNVN